jgi:indole-3-glycerol phosphate synthase
MNDILENIIQKKKESLEKRKKRVSLSNLKKRIDAGTRRDFNKALENKIGTNIIAEIKQASPSAGVICKDFNPAKIAREYTKGGAAAISVLTEEEYFKGDLAYLGVVRDNSELPLLCKDFIFDPYQLYEAAAFGADAVLLIAAILYGEELENLMNIAKELNICPLVEVHDKAELEKVLGTGAQVIGINNRNLKDLSVNLETSLALVSKIPLGKTIVIESGIKTQADTKLYLKQGVNSFLVGEALMREKDIAGALRKLINGKLH